MATLTVYPNPHPESTSVDGWAYQLGNEQTFAALRAAAGNSFSDDGSYINMGSIRADDVPDTYVSLVRGFFLFDTSALGGFAVISSVVLSLYRYSAAIDLGEPTVHIAAGNPASNTAIVAGDYDAISRVSFGSIAYADFGSSAYSNITLNGSGVAHISKDGITKFSSQLEWDIDNDTTGLVWSSAGVSYLQCWSADWTGTSRDPKLVITYSLAPRGSSAFGSTDPMIY